MRVIFFTYDFPYPTNSGGKMRAYNLMKHAGKGVEVFLFSFTRERISEDRIAAVKRIGVRDIKLFKRKKVSDLSNLLSFIHPSSSIFSALYYSEHIADQLQKAVDDWSIDIVHFESFYTGYYLGRTSAKEVFGTENIEFRLYEDYARYIARLPLKPAYFWEAKKIKKEEEMFYKKADMNLAVLSSEAAFIKDVSKKPCSVIPNGVNVSEFQYRPKKQAGKKVILFIGNFSYFPNVDAATYFYKHVFPSLQDDTWTFRIIGKNVTSLPFVDRPHISTSEFVDDIRDEYYAADVFVSPIRIGGGTNFKVLEAMACGTPVIAMSERVSALGAKAGEQYLSSNTPEEYRDAIRKIYSDESLRQRISKNARRLIEEKYSWEKIGAELTAVWKGLLN